MLKVKASLRICIEELITDPCYLVVSLLFNCSHSFGQFILLGKLRDENDICCDSCV